MLRSRVIPCLLIQNKGLVKTINFTNPKYIGDPINTVKLFNEKEVDEIIILDIDASAKSEELNYSLIEKLALECRMPLCYGGGVKNVQQASRLIELGVEKIALSSAIIENTSLISSISKVIGSQSVVAVIDVKKNSFGNYEVFINNGTKKIGQNFDMLLKQIEDYGAGEIVINSIDNDGVMKGYDLSLVEKVYNTVNIPITVIGGAGSKDHIFELIDRYKIIGAAAGSLFVFKGIYKAVLINYFTRDEINKL